MSAPVAPIKELLRLYPNKDLRLGQIFLLDKPLGWTSSNVVSKCRYLLRKHGGYRKIKVGHAGTLDPLATGLLIICVGRATKVAQWLTEQDKEYSAEITLGATTASYDLETPLENRTSYDSITQHMVQESMHRFQGKIQQQAPLYSAKHVNGVRAYELARKGKNHSITPVEVIIHQFTLESFTPPMLQTHIHCSKGTYIRSLAHDLGQTLGCGAYLSGLRRMRSGILSVQNALRIDEFEELILALSAHPNCFKPQ